MDGLEQRVGGGVAWRAYDSYLNRRGPLQVKGAKPLAEPLGVHG